MININSKIPKLTTTNIFTKRKSCNIKDPFMYDLDRHTYYINLDNRTDRKEHTIKQLKKIGVRNPNRFSAIKTRKTEPHYFGCTKSHLSVLKMAKKENLPFVFIVEDDVMFLDPKNTLERIEKSLDSNWDVLLLASSQNKNNSTRITDCLYKANYSYLATAYIVKNYYYDTLIKNIEESFKIPISFDMNWFKLQKIHNWYVVFPKKVAQKPGYSDNEGKFKNLNKYVDL